VEDPFIRTPPYYTEQAKILLETAREHGLEGIVCKQMESPYRPGRRSGEWVKVKIVASDEFVIGGWTPGRNDPRRIGALLLGYFESGRPGLVYAGKAGSGFKEADHRFLLEQLAPLGTGLNPFRTTVPERNAMYVRPYLVATVEYRRWIPGGNLQMAVYKGLRSDIPPSQVTDLR
jgi:bifunctional non-homologous end joining protein LigD